MQSYYILRLIDSCQIKPDKLRRYVNQFLLLSLMIEQTISESTAVWWLKKLGFTMCWVQKGVYIDGHGCPNVVEVRTSFINYMYMSVLP